MPSDQQRVELNVDQRLFFPAPRKVPPRSMEALASLPQKGHGGRPAGHAVSKDATIRQLNAAAGRQRGPLYLWWGARELGVSVPTLRRMLRDYGLNWPPPWPAPADRPISN